MTKQETIEPCKHQFWKDRNPENCLHCGKTETELQHEYEISIWNAAIDAAIASVRKQLRNGTVISRSHTLSALEGLKK